VLQWMPLCSQATYRRRVCAHDPQSRPLITEVNIRVVPGLTWGDELLIIYVTSGVNTARSISTAKCTISGTSHYGSGRTAGDSPHTVDGLFWVYINSTSHIIPLYRVANAVLFAYLVRSEPESWAVVWKDD